VSEPGFHCTGCRRPFPATGFPYCCTTCGGIFDFTAALPFDPLPFEPRQPRGLARYQRTYPIPSGASLISLGEGGTPLVPVRVGTRTVHFKCEFLNPTGSFKDRGTAVLVSALAAAGVRSIMEDSSGNAGASLAAYAARAGMRARIFVPDSASGPKRAQIEAYGAKVVTVPGPRTAASEAVRRQAEPDTVYASHAYLPHGLAGVATLAFELVEQLGSVPGAVVCPVGQGGLLLGMARGFEAMVAAGAAGGSPAIIGVQARACAPVWAVFSSGSAGLGWVREGPTVAEGIRVLYPVRGDAVLSAVEGSGGRLLAVDEEDILHGADVLASAGLWVEPTSAVVWPALVEMLDDLQDPIVAVLTGSGYKRRMELNP
jgi:threonine synthase